MQLAFKVRPVPETKDMRTIFYTFKYHKNTHTIFFTVGNWTDSNVHCTFHAVKTRILISFFYI